MIGEITAYGSSIYAVAVSREKEDEEKYIFVSACMLNQ
jgi:hypothetical protein